MRKAILSGIIFSLALGALTPACEGNIGAPAGFMLHFTTDMDPPKGFNVMSLLIQKETKSGWVTVLERDYQSPTEITYPTTLGITSSGDPNQRGYFKAIAKKDGKTMVVREIRAVVPNDRVARMTIALNWSCVEKPCPAGQTCDPETGLCAPIDQDSDDLPTWDGDKDAGIIVRIDGGMDSSIPDDASVDRSVDGPVVDATPDVPADVTPDIKPSDGSADADACACPDDGNSCTDDKCEAGKCVHPPKDGIACTSQGASGTCHASACCTGCWDGKACVAGTATTSCGKAGGNCSECTVTAQCQAPACTSGACTTTPTTGNPCTGGICKAGVCKCGGAGEPCCANLQCEGGLACSNGTCGACGATGQACCSGSSCSPGNVCNAAKCEACGTANALCCAGSTPSEKCQTGTTCNASNRCVACGGANQPCCGGTSCGSSGLVCQAGTCKACGAPGQPCCANLCNSGANCSTAGCVACGGLAQPCCKSGTACTQQRICANDVCAASCAQGLQCASGTSCCDARAIPSGTFMMGRSLSGTDACPTNTTCDDDELPEHASTISAFSLDTFEVSVGRFRKYVDSFTGTPPSSNAGAHPLISNSGWNADWNTHVPISQAALRETLNCGHPTYVTWTDAAGQNEAKPINCVSWYLAFAFCIWDGGRLPTEGEWEMAAAGQQNRRYPWGDQAPNCGLLNFNDCVGSGLITVGSYSPSGNSANGVCDLSGNVAEWVLDWHAPYPSSSVSNYARVAAGGSQTRVVRGGGFSSPAADARTAARRDQVTPDDAKIDIGFRCARNP